MRLNLLSRYFVSALFSFTYSNLLSQITFNKTIDFANGNEFSSSVVVVEEGYVLTGNGWGYEAGNYFDEKFKYCKINEAGDVVWKRFLGDSMISIYSGNECIQTFDGNLVLSSGIQYNDDFDADVFLVKFVPETGDTLFFRIYETESFQFGEAVQQYSDGNLLINMYDEDYPTTLMKTNATGDIIWQEFFGVSNEGTSSIIKLIEDTLTLLTYFGSCEPLGFKWRTIDSSGNVLFEEFFEGECTAFGMKSIGGGIIGAAVDYPDNPYITYIYRANNVGEFLWKYYSSWDLDTLYDFGLQIFLHEELPNGDMIIAGQYATNPIGSYKGFVSKINAEGDPYWERAYTSNGDPYGENRILDVALTSDSGFILAGGAYSDIIEDTQNFWVLKLDSMGCLTPGCDTLDDAVFELPFNDEVVLFPNPAHDYFVLQSGEVFTEDIDVHILNTAGQILQKTKAAKGSSSLYIKTENYPPGFYFVKMIDAHKRVLVKKVVIE
ncbi:MAG: T9SS type A sorting domain-containing protein [Chitinophagales bacterium]